MCSSDLEAPALLYSTATSTVAEAPRAMEFLQSVHRFDVATSRARSVAAVVASRALVAPERRTPRPMRLANARRRFVEPANRIG